MDTINILIPLATLILGGGATWIFTIKYDRKQAEASAMEKVQAVYQGLIEDLNKDRTRLEGEINSIKEDQRSLKRQMREMENLMRAARTCCCELAPSCTNFKAIDVTKL